MDKERRDYLRGFATSRNVVSMSPDTVVELLDALEAAIARLDRALRERDKARAELDKEPGQ